MIASIFLKKTMVFHELCFDIFTHLILFNLIPFQYYNTLVVLFIVLKISWRSFSFLLLLPILLYTKRHRTFFHFLFFILLDYITYDLHVFFHFYVHVYFNVIIANLFYRKFRNLHKGFAFENVHKSLSLVFVLWNFSFLIQYLFVSSATLDICRCHCARLLFRYTTVYLNVSFGHDYYYYL